MALFQKKPQVTSSAPLYSIGTNKTYLIIGLGNPGKKYIGTRHNIGFAAIDYYAEKNDFPAWTVKKDLKSTLSIKVEGQNRIILMKPAEFMNNSGEGARLVQRFYRVYNKQTLVIYDELALDFGHIRSRVGGSDAGHNGVKSLIEHIDEDFSRIRIGIGNEISEKAEASNFVLGKFTKEEVKNVTLIYRETNEIINEFIYSGALTHDTRVIS
jgi:PTH1 family peptidyl-tRNA hydrolase